MKAEIRKHLPELFLVMAGVFLYLFYVTAVSRHLENGLELMELQKNASDEQAVLRQMQRGEILTRICDLYALYPAAVLFYCIFRKRPAVLLCYGVCSLAIPFLLMLFTGDRSFYYLEPLQYCGKYRVLYLFAALTGLAGALVSGRRKTKKIAFPALKRTEGEERK